MANFVFNRAAGSGAELARATPGGVQLILLKGMAADAVNQDFATLTEFLANASNIEADFTGYARKLLSNVQVTTDNATNVTSIDADDLTYDPAGGAVDNDVLAAVILSTTGEILMSKHDLIFTTTGSLLRIFLPGGGFYQAANV